jgi:predicted ATPase
LDTETKLEFAIAYLSTIVSIRVRDDLLQGISPEMRRRQTFDGLKATFVGESQNKPVVVILEDIHWIDQISEEFLLYLSSSIAKNRIMILALHRPDYQCPWARSSTYQQISIRRLSHTESEEMLHKILGVKEVAAEVKDLVQRKAEGNPFFMEELILELLESSLVCKEDKICRLVDQTDPPVPATVQDVIMARIDRLEDTYKRTLQLASVIGREFVFTILEKIAEPRNLSICLSMPSPKMLLITASFSSSVRCSTPGLPPPSRKSKTTPSKSILRHWPIITKRATGPRRLLSSWSAQERRPWSFHL